MVYRTPAKMDLTNEDLKMYFVSLCHEIDEKNMHKNTIRWVLARDKGKARSLVKKEANLKENQIWSYSVVSVEDFSYEDEDISELEK